MTFLQSFSPAPVLIELGPITIYWYGLFFALGIVAGYLVARRLWLKSGRLAQRFDSLVLWVIIFGIIGARLVDVFLFEWGYFKDNLTDIYKIWQGGLAIHGGLLGGFIALWWYVKKNQDKLWVALDIMAPAVALGQAIGRWGNYFNQEIFGTPTNFPWGIFIAPANRPAEYLSTSFFHPIFLYESIGLLIIFCWLIRLRQRKTFAGQVVAYYLLATGLLRLVLEFIRTDEQLTILGLRSGLIISILWVVVSLGIFIHIRARKKKSTEVV